MLFGSKKRESQRGALRLNLYLGGEIVNEGATAARSLRPRPKPTLRRERRNGCTLVEDGFDFQAQLLSDCRGGGLVRRKDHAVSQHLVDSGALEPGADGRSQFSKRFGSGVDRGRKMCRCRLYLALGHVGVVPDSRGFNRLGRLPEWTRTR